ncbi:MAG: hypothetical protein EHM59_00600 [Betaproteobacteria bacterium]|nr:MAG: hypothetical protein EHM59_09300 [Betaproteobacteria bacterium]RPI48739.1 MAG: hypothetical protein EHM59_00600 [Betaproteobacteria bacterium]
MIRTDPEGDDPRRRLLIRTLSLGLLSVLAPGGTTLAQSVFGARPSKLPPEQSIYRLVGTVKVNDRDADLQTRIRAGDTVETGRDGELVFVIGSNAMILRAGSRLAIAPPEQPSERTSFIVTGLRLLTGAILSVSRRQPMRLETAVATIGIRGTGFYAESEPEETYFCTCYGEAEVVATADPESRTSVVSRAHDQPVYIVAGGAPGNNIRSAPFKNHTDDELRLIETLVGRSPPFGASGYSYPGSSPDYP